MHCLYVVIQVTADKMKHEDQIGARRLDKMSIGVSTTGIVVTCIIIITLISVYVSNANR